MTLDELVEMLQRTTPNGATARVEFICDDDEDLLVFDEVVYVRGGVEVRLIRQVKSNAKDRRRDAD